MHRQAQARRDAAAVIHKTHRGDREPAQQERPEQLVVNTAAQGKNHQCGTDGHRDRYTAAARCRLPMGASIVGDIENPPRYYKTSRQSGENGADRKRRKSPNHYGGGHIRARRNGTRRQCA